MEVPKGTEVRTELGRLAFDVRQGVAGAEDRLARSLSQPLRIMCRMRGLAAHDADDLIQESLVTVIRQLRGTEPISFDAIGVYARNTAVFILTGQHRRQARRAELLHQTADDMVPLPPSSPEQMLGSSQVAAAVHEAVESLPQPRDRALIRRHYLQQGDKDELCKEFGLTSRQFDRVIYNARQRLLQVLRKRGWGGPDGH